MLYAHLSQSNFTQFLPSLESGSCCAHLHQHNFTQHHPFGVSIGWRLLSTIFYIVASFLSARLWDGYFLFSAELLHYGLHSFRPSMGQVTARFRRVFCTIASDGLLFPHPSSTQQLPFLANVWDSCLFSAYLLTTTSLLSADVQDGHLFSAHLLTAASFPFR